MAKKDIEITIHIKYTFQCTFWPFSIHLYISVYFLTFFHTFIHFSVLSDLFPLKYTFQCTFWPFSTQIYIKVYFLTFFHSNIHFSVFSDLFPLPECMPVPAWPGCTTSLWRYAGLSVVQQLWVDKLHTYCTVQTSKQSCKRQNNISRKRKTEINITTWFPCFCEEHPENIMQRWAGVPY